jgi:predicted ATPase/DNA-binding CsgD family transcriptional regulator
MRDRSSGQRGLIRGELSGFVGRRAELGRVRAALAGARLVTLTGPAGIGKTRLAVQAATEARRAFRDGAWMAELAGLRDPGLLASEVARAFGLLDQSAGWAAATLADSLAGRHALLVPDNCEHLLDACAVLAGALLRACPGLRILATSRQVLGVPGEVTFPLPPLSVPAMGQLPVSESLLEYEAVRLFAECGAAVLPGFTVDAGNREAIAELDTIREYGQQRLAEAGGDAGLRRRHRDWYAALAARQAGLGAGQIEWIDALDADHDNVRAALEFCLAEPGEAHAGLRMACDLWLYWETRGHLTEGRRFLDALIARARPAPGLKVRGLWVAGYLALVQSDGDAARSLLEEALTAGNSLGDLRAIAYAAQFLGRALWFTGEPDRGLALTESALSRHRAAGNWQGAVLTLVQLGVMRTLMGHIETSVTLLEECIAGCQAQGERWNRSYALWGLGLAAWLAGDDGRAAELEQAALRLKRDVGDQVAIPLCLETLAWIAASRDQAARAADLLGAATAAWISIPAALPAPLAGYRETAASRARNALGEASFTAHLVRAQAMPLSHVAAMALGEPAGAVELAPASADPVRLTGREHEVAALVAQGLSNRDIAARLVISARTAEAHVEHIMVKLGLNARAQIAAWSAANTGRDA